MSQSREWSAIETVSGTAIGFVVAYIATAIVFPLFGHNVTHSQNFWITCIFTVISLIRGYYVRRLFNWINAQRAA